MADEKALQEQAARLMASGQVGNAIVEDGQIKVKNQVSGNWEPWHGQATQDPAGSRTP